ncbi:hypothetical protein ACEUZ9_004647 [Paracoccus litorisediminis]|uniref:hypothetical protein n=1 Tax=Paracoccus litorisediminis TaxID=2006130 RepID=UPI00372EF629
MNKIYALDGTAIKHLKSAASKLKKADGLTHKEALDRIASEHGHADWDRLAAAQLIIDEDFAFDFVLRRQQGRDTITFALSSIAEDLDTLWGLQDDQNLVDEVPTIQLYRSVEFLGDGGIDLRLEFTPFIGHAEWDKRPSLFKPAGTLEEFCISFETFEDDDKPGQLISRLNKAGFFGIDPFDQLLSGEYEALLELEMRKFGLHVGERILFNSELNSRRIGKIDFDRRCFANRLSNGGVLFSNGAESLQRLVWKVLSAAEFEDISTELHAAFPRGPEKSHASEAWLFDRVLTDLPQSGVPVACTALATGPQDAVLTSDIAAFKNECGRREPFPIWLQVGEGKRVLVVYDPVDPAIALRLPGRGY